SRSAAFLSPPALPPVPVPPQPALITATMATMARAAGGRSAPLMVFSPPVAVRPEFVVPGCVALDPAKPDDRQCGRPGRGRPGDPPRPGRGRAGPTRRR